MNLIDTFREETPAGILLTGGPDALQERHQDEVGNMGEGFADWATNGQYSDPDESVDVFSPSLFTSAVTFGIVSKDEAEEVGIPETTSSEDIRNTVLDDSGDGQGVTIARSLRLIAWALVIGAAIYVVGQLFTFEVPVGS